MNHNNRQWTPAQRARQAQRIRQYKPWLKSTGPKTAAGKLKSSRNAYQPCLHTPEIQAIQRYLEASRLLLKALARKRKEAEEKQRAAKRLVCGKVLHIVGDAPLPVPSHFIHPWRERPQRVRHDRPATGSTPEIGSCIEFAGHL